MNDKSIPDIFIIRQAIREGKIKAFVRCNKIFLLDIESGECVLIGNCCDEEE